MRASWRVGKEVKESLRDVWEIKDEESCVVIRFTIMCDIEEQCISLNIVIISKLN